MGWLVFAVLMLVGSVERMMHAISGDVLFQMCTYHIRSIYIDDVFSSTAIRVTFGVALCRCSEPSHYSLFDCIFLVLLTPRFVPFGLYFLFRTSTPCRSSCLLVLI